MLALVLMIFYSITWIQNNFRLLRLNMAEVVQSHVEEMLPEVYELQQLGVLSPSEAKSVIKTRTDFEYKMRRRISKKQDFLHFIDYELKLEKLKTSRIAKLGLNDVSEGARYRSLQRIHFIFQKCLKKYKTDVALWIRYIMYCKRIGSIRSLGLAFVESLKHNPQCTALWILSAKNEMEGNKNMTAARSIFLQALKFNPESAKLWTEYFRLEVLHVEKLRKRQQIMQACDKLIFDKADEEFMNFKVAKIVFNNALNSLEFNSEDLTGFYDVTKKLDDGDDLTRFLFESALQKYPLNALLWISLARFVMEKDSKRSVSILNSCLNTIKSFECLTHIIKFVITEKDKFDDISTLLIKFFNQDLKDITITDPTLVVELGKLLVANNLSNILHPIFDIALGSSPKNKDLWLFKIENFSDSPEDDLLEALKVLPSDTDLWYRYLSYLSLNDMTGCTSKWEEVIKQGFSAPLIPAYIEYTYTTQGLEKTRQVFKDIQNWHTLTEKVINSMINYEINNNSDPSTIRNTFDVLTTNHSTVTNWRQYLDFCQKTCPEKISTVLWKCKAVLTETQVALLL